MAATNSAMNGARLEEKCFLPVAAGSTTTFSPGDMMYYDETALLAKPMSSYTWAGSDAAIRRALKPLFVGVACDAQFADMPARFGYCLSPAAATAAA